MVEGEDEADLSIRRLEGHPFAPFQLTDDVVALADARLLAPVLPSKVVAVGRNYAEHAKEMGNADPTTEPPIVFIKPSTSVVGPGDAVQYPVGISEEVSYEGEQWGRAKGFDTFCPLGPWVSTDVDPADLAITTTVNGELKQAGRTSQMVRSIDELVSHISMAMTLLPGDVILTGTPAGVGPLAVGDQVSVTIEQVGTLTNRVVARG